MSLGLVVIALVVVGLLVLAALVTLVVVLVVANGQNGQQERGPGLPEELK